MLEFLSKRRKQNPARQFPAVIAVGGFSAQVGKTALVCDLLRSFPDWEAIKVTRGHYEACCRDEQLCCVDHKASHQPLVQSGYDLTYEANEDTRRYWDAGASNVHLVASTDQQVGESLWQALGQVTAAGVFVEGNRFTQYVRPDFMLMVAPPDGGTINDSARRAFPFATALYINDPNGSGDRARQRFASWLKDSTTARLIGKLPIFTREDLPDVVAQVWAAQLDHRQRSGVQISSIAS